MQYGAYQNVSPIIGSAAHLHKDFPCSENTPPISTHARAISSPLYLLMIFSAIQEVYRAGLLDAKVPTVTLNPNLLEAQARKHVGERSFNYAAGGAGERSTMEANRLALRQWKVCRPLQASHQLQNLFLCISNFTLQLLSDQKTRSKTPEDMAILLQSLFKALH